MTDPDPPCLALTGPIDARELRATAELQTSHRDKAKLRGLALLSEGVPLKKAARDVRMSSKTLLATIMDYNRGGLYAVLPARRGRPIAMPDQDILRTRAALLDELPSFKAWTPMLLSLWLKEQFGHSHRPEALARVALIITDGRCVLPPHTARSQGRRAKKLRPLPQKQKPSSAD